MTATEHSHRAWVLVDPDQDYEESLTILGVYRTDKDAMYAARPYIEKNAGRDLEAQERRGNDLLRVWTWRWREQKWSLCYRGSPGYKCWHNHAEVESWRPGLT